MFAVEKLPGPKRKQSYSNHPFSGAMLMLVSGRVVKMAEENLPVGKRIHIFILYVFLMIKKILFCMLIQDDAMSGPVL